MKKETAIKELEKRTATYSNDLAKMMNEAANLCAGTYVYINASDAVQSNEAFALQCLSTADPNAAQYNKNCFYFLLAKHHGGNKQIMMECVKERGSLLRFGAENVLNDKDIVLEAVKNDPSASVYSLPAIILVKDKDIAMAALNNMRGIGDVISHCHPTLKNDTTFMLTALSLNGTLLKLAPKRFQDSEKAVKIAVTENGNAIEYASERIQMNKSIVMLAVKSDPNAYIVLPEAMKADEDIAYEAISHDGGLMHYAPDNIKNSKRHALAAVKRTPYAYYKISEALQTDDDIFKIAMSSTDQDFQYVFMDRLGSCKKVCNTKRLMLQLIKSNKKAARYCSTRLLHDKDIQALINA